jgi:hypothetical protein
MDAVSTLMQERQRFEAWIVALEEKRAITPPHVYERVRGDYETRLREVIQKLSGRTTELKDTVAALTARLAKLQTEENARRDERYEAELRATVGEFESEKWDALRRSIDDTITRLAAERTSVSTELARVQQILSMAGSAAAGAAAEMKPRPDADGAGAGKGGRFDELAFLSSVVESPKGAPPQAPPPTPGAVPAASNERATVPASAPPSAGVPTTAGTAPITRPSGRQPAQPAATAPRQPTGSNQTVSKTDTTDGAVPSYLRDVPTEAAKSLKCHDCGTMNLPTEWYCERCGGELAAM